MEITPFSKIELNSIINLIQYGYFRNDSSKQTPLVSWCKHIGTPSKFESRLYEKKTTWNWKNDYLGAIYMYFESNPKSVKTKLRCIESWEPQRAGAAEGRSRRGAEPRRCAQFLLH